MSASERIPVTPEVLRWARERAGLTQEAAAKGLGVSENTLRQWEEGTLEPTIKQLRKAAKRYGRPLAVLLLPDAPNDYQPLRDFRTLTTSEQALSPKLLAELRRAEMQREVILELLELAPDVVPESVGLPDIRSDAPDQAGRKLRRFLEVEDSEQQAWKGPHEALRGWTSALEAKGILVIHARSVQTDEARGFSLSDHPHPLIAVTGADWPRARIFTLLHELAHIALNIGGLCDLHETQPDHRAEVDRLEHICNAIAAAALIPKDWLLAISPVSDASRSSDWDLEDLQRIADIFSVSSEALLLRLIGLQRASWETYWTRKEELDQIYEDARQHERERRRESSGGPSYYTVKARDIGHTYAHSVIDAYRTHAISTLDVADYLDIKYNQLPKLEQVLR